MNFLNKLKVHRMILPQSQIRKYGQYVKQIHKDVP